MRYSMLFMFLCLSTLRVSAQAIDRVIVERYYVQPGASASEPPLVTYRVFIDLAADHELQMVYGDARHQLKFRTTADFYNDKLNGTEYGDRIAVDRLNTFPLALDSWLTIGAASKEHMGVPLALDTDGSILECPPYAGYDLGSAGPRPTPLCSADGLLKVPEIKEVVPFKFNTEYLSTVRGNEIESTIGAWGVLGGTKGVTDDNVVLIAQLTTTGDLFFSLNLQIETPDHQAVRYVWSDPVEGEILFDGLTYGKPLKSTVAERY
ncbi:MAG: hypothetical protein ABI432_06210 [Flavobacteriales bacterium]